MKFSRCRDCGSVRAQGDPCAGCGKGLPEQTLRIRRGGVVSLTKAQGMHAAMVVPAATARAMVRF